MNQTPFSGLVQLSGTMAIQKEDKYAGKQSFEQKFSMLVNLNAIIRYNLETGRLDFIGRPSKVTYILDKSSADKLLRLCQEFESDHHLDDCR